MDQAHIQFNPNLRDQVYFLQNTDTRIEVLQNQHHIWMEINGVIQSAFCREAPFRPVLSHSVIMMLPLIHGREPTSILELGGGGLSAQRYLALTHPSINFHSIEYSQEVIDTTLNHLPKPIQFNVEQANAFDIIKEYAAVGRQFDWLMVDLFHGASLPEQATEQKFFSDLKALISDEGWLIFNCLSNKPQDLTALQLAIEEVFKKPVTVFAAPAMQNHIFLLKKGTDFRFPNEIQQHDLSESIRQFQRNSDR